MQFTASSEQRSLCTSLRPHVRRSCCIRVPSDIIHDPDPSIYDQLLVFNSGGAPTFNSPDINTVDVWPLRPIDNLTATVRNLSPDCSANQTRVDLTWSAWGIGMPRSPIASSYVDLARAGFAGSEQTLSWPLPPALKAAGRYGIFVNLIHPYDRNPNNNSGEQTIDGYQTSTGRSHTFIVPVRNPTSTVQTIALSVLPAPVVPWVTVVPASVTLGAGAQQNVMVSITVPAAVPPSPPGTLISASVDVLATMGGNYLGGVDLAILIDA